MATNGIDQFLRTQAQSAASFSSTRAVLERELYWSRTSTEIEVYKCSDARVKGSRYLKTPLGVLTPRRTIGGKFEMWWPDLQKEIEMWRQRAAKKFRHRCLSLFSYHFSRGDEHRGCAGFDCQTNDAIAYTTALLEDFKRIYQQSTMFGVMVGFETDLEAMVLHGESGEVLDLAEVEITSVSRLEWMIRRLFPSMDEESVRDFVPRVQANIEHIQEVRELERPIEALGHQEHMLLVGRGYEYMHDPNALIVSPHTPDLAVPIASAGGVILNNINQGLVIPAKTPIVVVTSAPYFEPIGPEPELARQKSLGLCRFAYRVLEERVPELVRNYPVSTLAVTIDMTTWRLNIHDRVDR